MNNKSLKISNKLVFIVVSFVLLILVSFMSVHNVESAFAATSDDSLLETGLLSTSENCETYTVNVYNGSEGVGAFQILQATHMFFRSMDIRLITYIPTLRVERR